MLTVAMRLLNLHCIDVVAILCESDCYELGIGAASSGLVKNILYKFGLPLISSRTGWDARILVWHNFIHA